MKILVELEDWIIEVAPLGLWEELEYQSQGLDCVLQRGYCLHRIWFLDKSL